MKVAGKKESWEEIFGENITETETMKCMMLNHVKQIEKI